MSGFLSLGATNSGGESFFTPPADTFQPGWFATCQPTAGTPPIPSCLVELEAAHAAYLNSLVAPSAASQGYVASAGTAPATSYSPTISLSNVTRPGQPFQAGDSFALSIIGAAPNKPVAVTSQHNGAGSSANFGNTDSHGNFSTSGVMTADTIGSWTEQWSVGGVPLQALTFTVSAAPSATSASGGGLAPAPLAANPLVANPLALSASASWFSGSTFGLPNWMLLLAGGGLLYMGFRHA